MAKWLNEDVQDQDVVISTRVRIARNLKNYIFPPYLELGDSDKLTNEILNVAKDSLDIDNYSFSRIMDLSDREKSSYIEEYLISPSLSKNRDKGSFLLRKDEKVTIMINEEDHLRIQTLVAGFDLYSLWELSNEIDDKLESKLEYAYHKNLGYLTTCPTNVGTGLRASVMVHIPSIALTGNLNTMVETLRKVGLTARGIYGEGSQGLGNLYQISNQTTLGVSEEDVLNRLNRVVIQIIERERKYRKYLQEKRGTEIEDKVFRSYGILQNCRLISTKEAMGHLSNLKLAYNMGYIRDERLKHVVKLMLEIRPATIQSKYDRDLNANEREKIRARIIREYLNGMEE